MRVVFDTNVLVSSTIWNYSSAKKILIALIQKEIKNYISIDIINEYKEILERDFKLDYYEINRLIRKIFSFSDLVYPSEKIDYIQEDPDDDLILECAIKSQANYIVTYDKHLLRLKSYENIKILSPEELRGILFSQI